ncbi:MAG: helix-turn-helix transcriptional regulator [Clostridia bacterium]|nr:helix-turn-helix transcriptional regulator [Clostridia bacterium]
MNTTVADYITQRRIAQSQRLIANGIPLSDVCFQVGFGSLSAFNRAFKSLTHMTPSQYRIRTLHP